MEWKQFILVLMLVLRNAPANGNVIDDEVDTKTFDRKDIGNSDFEYTDGDEVQDDTHFTYYANGGKNSVERFEKFESFELQEESQQLHVFNHGDSEATESFHRQEYQADGMDDKVTLTDGDIVRVTLTKDIGEYDVTDDTVADEYKHFDGNIKYSNIDFSEITRDQPFGSESKADDTILPDMNNEQQNRVFSNQVNNIDILSEDGHRNTDAQTVPFDDTIYDDLSDTNEQYFDGQDTEHVWHLRGFKQNNWTIDGEMCQCANNGEDGCACCREGGCQCPLNLGDYGCVQCGHLKDCDTENICHEVTPGECFKHNDIPLNWNQAAELCSKDKFDLPKLSNTEEQKSYLSMLDKRQSQGQTMRVWLGARVTDYLWRWTKDAEILGNQGCFQFSKDRHGGTHIALSQDGLNTTSCSAACSESFFEFAAVKRGTKKICICWESDRSFKQVLDQQCNITFTGTRNNAFDYLPIVHTNGTKFEAWVSPNQQSVGNCAALGKKYNFKWMKKHCDEKHRYICQYDMGQLNCAFKEGLTWIYKTCISVHNNDPVSWFSAKAKCAELGGTLVKIESKRVSRELKSKLNESYYWIGLTNRHWNWADNTDVLEHNFMSLKNIEFNQPSCASIVSDGYWSNGISCDERLPFSCQKRNFDRKIDIGELNPYDGNEKYDGNQFVESDPKTRTKRNHDWWPIYSSGSGHCWFSCENGGYCDYTWWDEARCFCPIEWTGERCELDYCSSSPCNNGGTCMTIPNSDRYKCSCDTARYYGPRCSYDVPEITGVQPNYGPVAGGTIVTFSGQNLNGVLSVAADQLRFTIQSKNATTIQVRTSQYTEDNVPSGDLTFSLAFPLDKKLSPNEKFKYLPNPVIDGIHPSGTIESGGTKITVSGRNIQSIAKPVLKISAQYINNSTQIDTIIECIPRSGTYMTCEIPDLMDITTSRRRRQIMPDISDRFHFLLALLLDGINDYNPLSSKFPQYEYLEIYKDPTFDELTETVLYDPQTDGFVGFKGQNLKPGIPISEFKVTIGSEICADVALGVNMLYCRPPAISRNITSESEEPIKIRVGSHLAYEVGVLSYVTSSTTSEADEIDTVPTLTTFVPVVIVLCIAIVVLVVVLVVCLLRKRGSQPADSIESGKRDETDGNQYHDLNPGLTNIELPKRIKETKKSSTKDEKPPRPDKKEKKKPKKNKTESSTGPDEVYYNTDNTPGKDVYYNTSSTQDMYYNTNTRAKGKGKTAQSTAPENTYEVAHEDKGAKGQTYDTIDKDEHPSESHMYQLLG